MNTNIARGQDQEVLMPRACCLDVVWM